MIMRTFAQDVMLVMDGWKKWEYQVTRVIGNVHEEVVICLFIMLLRVWAKSSR